MLCNTHYSSCYNAVGVFIAVEFRILVIVIEGSKFELYLAIQAGDLICPITFAWEMMANERSIVIVGNGVAANVLGFYLRHDVATQSASIIRIAHDRVYRPCSQSTTSHIALRHTQRGVSPLGDLLVEAFEAFRAFAELYAPSGVYACEHFHLWSQHSDRAAGLFRRYEGVCFSGDKIAPFTGRLARPHEMARTPAYVVDPVRYLDFLSAHTRYDSVIDEAVVAVTKDALRLASNREVVFDRLFLCTGQFTHAFADAFRDPTHLKHSKPVAGTYLEFDLADFRKTEFRDLTRAFCLDVEEVNVVLRPESQKVLLGATSTNDSDSYDHDTKVFEMYAKVRTHLAGMLTLPPRDRAGRVTGVRHKGHRRMPFWGEVAPRVYAVYGLYKNAFMTANLAAKELVGSL